MASIVLWPGFNFTTKNGNTSKCYCQIKEYFPNRPMIVFKRAPSIKDKLVRRYGHGHKDFWGPYKCGSCKHYQGPRTQTYTKLTVLLTVIRNLFCVLVGIFT